MNDMIMLELSADEALVLFDWIKRFNRIKNTQFEDLAEERVLWDIEALLEKSLVAPLDPDYRDMLIEARSRVRDHD